MLIRGTHEARQRMIRDCPRCGISYSEPFAFCAVCREPLVEVGCGAPRTWVVVATAANSTVADILAGRLAAEGIACLVEARGLSMVPVPEAGADYVLVRVPCEAVEQALEIAAMAERGEWQIDESEFGEEA